MTLAIVAVVALKCLVLSQATVQQQHSLFTKWGKAVTAENAHREYPRPQMVRDDWVNLNGIWDLAIVDENAKPVSSHKILVPFPVESELSGVHKILADGQSLLYHRSFKRPAGERILLHFGASDWETSVLVNGKLVGTHLGGYDPFSFDVTDALTESGDQDLVVTVVDPTDKDPQPRGKQVLKPQGIFYTPTSGIWQTVWLEPVPKSYIGDLKIEAWPRAGQVNVTPKVEGLGAGYSLSMQVLDGSRIVATSKALSGQPLVAKVPTAKWWSPDSPFLYNLRITVRDAEGKPVDSVTSYFAFREVALAKNLKGQPMVTLNGKAVFLFGPLDQGFWPDGIYTAPSDEAMKYDLEVTKQLGFNTIRKHVKVEPQRWYYWCDKMGILVMQDMPSGDKFIGPSDPDIERTPESRTIYYTELQAMIDNLRNHPSIICWIPFNEGWGQFETKQVTDFIRKYDPARLVDSTTGWTDRGVGDFHDVHAYPGPGAPKPETGRASLLGEFGGLGLVVPDHTWTKEGWGYQSYKTPEELTSAMEKLFLDLRILRETAGLSGAIYTQTTDVETELNGLMTYDRALIKADQARLKKAIQSVYKAAPKITNVVPTSELQPQVWAMTSARPADGWNQSAFDDSEWQKSKGGFGTKETPGAIVGTEWKTGDIWIRRTFELPANLSTKDLFIRIHHDDDVEVYLDGKLVLAKPGWTTNYTLVHWPSNQPELAKGKHVIAVYCHQNRGGQFIDLGLVTLRE